VSVNEILTERILRQGPLSFSEVLEVALYHPEAGFYETGGAAGRRQADFLTSPEVGGLFGAVLARALDGWWREMGEPDPYLVVEAGAGVGTLARTLLAADPACADALRYVLVERSAALRRSHGAHLPLEDPALVLPPVDPDSGRALADAPAGPICVSLAELPRVSGIPAVVVANELLDNLGFDLAERRPSGWSEVRIGCTREQGGWRGEAEAGPRQTAFDEVLVPLDETRNAELDRLAPDAPEGGRVPLQEAAAEWLRSALKVAGPGEAGRVVVFDYAATTADLARRPQASWLRTYRGHGRGGAYLDHLGQQDVTCELAVDQLAGVKAPVADSSQSAWLAQWGIAELVAAADETWVARAHVGDLVALAARSRMNEARALLDPQGLGAFRVLEWNAGRA
jgi:SAM-dependent MidA family methyltransferase